MTTNTDSDYDHNNDSRGVNYEYSNVTRVTPQFGASLQVHN